MKVLIVASANSGKISPIIESQAKSILILNENFVIDFYPVIGFGIIGYLKNVISLRKKIKIFVPDLIHAHYSYCGFLTSLCFSRVPIITSLMGSDLYKGKIHRLGVNFFYKIFWNICIVKSPDMKKRINIPSVSIIPNGVDLNTFYPLDKNDARKILNWDIECTIILFSSNPSRPEKYFKLASDALQLLSPQYKLKWLSDVKHEDMIYQYNASDVILLTSLYEGSPNVIKEAMACNCPVVSTDVGDVRWLFGDEPGHFISSFEPLDVAEKIKLALTFSEKYGRTKGRDRIINLGLDSDTIANKIIDIYKIVIQEN